MAKTGKQQPRKHRLADELSIMDLILYTIKIRLANQFINKVWWRILLQIVMFALVFFYALGFAKIYDSLAFEGQTELQPYFLFALYGILFVFTFLRGFFPGYSPRRDPISRQYPVNMPLRFFTNLASELFAQHFLVLLMALLVILVSATSFSFAYFAVGVSVLLGAHLLRRVVQTNIDNQLNRSNSRYLVAIIGVAAAIFAATTGTIMLWKGNIWGLLLLGLFMPLLFIADYSAESCVVAAKEKSASESEFFNNNIFLSLILRSKNIRVTLLMAFGFKIVLLSVVVYFNLFQEGSFYLDSPIIILLASPVFYFTYLFNNTWGHFRCIWLTLDRAGRGGWDIFKFQGLLLLYPLLIDIIIIGIYMLFPNTNQSFFLIYYISFLAIAFPISIISSLYQPILVLEFNVTRHSTSILFSYILIIVAILLCTPLYNNWLYIGYPVFIGMAIFSAVAVLKEYGKIRPRLFTKLFKSKN